MKTLLAVAALLLPFVSMPAQAAGGPKGLGLGVTFGNPTGLTAKYFMSDIHAFDTGFGSGPDLYVDYLFHGWQAFRQPPFGKLSAILGLGARVETRNGDGRGKNDDDDDEVGIRGVFGVAFYTEHMPVEVTLELVPVVNLTGDDGTDLDVGLAFRYYFTRFN